MSSSNTRIKWLAVSAILINMSVLCIILFLRWSYGIRIREEVRQNIYLKESIVEISRVQSELFQKELKLDWSLCTSVANTTIPDLNSFRIAEPLVIMIISNNTCPSCIPQSMELLSRLIRKRPDIDFLVVSNHVNLTGLVLMLERSGIPREVGIYSGEKNNPILNRAELPMLLRVNEKLQIERACVIDKHVPVGFYDYFVQSSQQ